VIADLQGDEAKPTDAAVRKAIEEAKMAPDQYGGIGSRMAGEKFLSNTPKSQVERIQAQIVAESLRPTIDAIGKAITGAIQAARKPTAAEEARAIYDRIHAGDIVLKADGNTLAKTSKNATDARRSPNAR
jgi:hypothetical protein